MKNTVEEGTDFYWNGRHVGKVCEVNDVTEPDGFPTFEIHVEPLANLSRDEVEEIMKLDSQRTFPPFATVNSTSLRHLNNGLYERPSGGWEVRAEWVEGKLRVCAATSGYLRHLRGLELVECDEQYFKDDNHGYV